MVLVVRPRELSARISFPLNARTHGKQQHLESGSWPLRLSGVRSTLVADSNRAIRPNDVQRRSILKGTHKMMRLVLAIGVTLAATAPAFAQLSFEHQPKKDPYRNLFSPEAERIKAATAAALRAREREARRPCMDHAMRVVPANPDVDAKIKVAPPSDVDHKIRSVTPPPRCNPE